MYYKQLIAPIKTTQRISAMISVLINSLTITLILTKSPKQLGSYKYLMLFISVNEILYSVVDVLLEPLHYSHGSSYLVISECRDKFLNARGLLILNSFYWGLFGSSMAIFAIHFVYRWMVVTENDILSSFGLDLDDYTYLGAYLYEVSENGEIVKVYLNSFFGLLITSVTMMTSISIVVSFGTRCYAIIRSIVAISQHSEKYRTLQNQLFYALAFQTLIPFVLMHMPVSIVMTFVFLNIDLRNFTAPVSITIVLYPALDPIPTLIIIENYRKTILGFIGFSKQPNTVDVVVVS